ncbi:uncharacterized protein [Malus domestica]
MENGDFPQQVSAGICTGMMSAETLKKYMCKEIYMIQKIANKLESMNDLAAEPMEPDTLADIANRLRQIESSCEVDMRLEENVNYLVDEEYHTPASQFVLNLTSAAQLFARVASEDGRRIQLAHATDMVAPLFHLFYFMARQLQLIPNCATMNWVNFHCSHQFKEMVGVTESLLDRCFEPLIFWDMDDSIFEAIGDCSINIMSSIYCHNLFQWLQAIIQSWSSC